MKHFMALGAVAIVLLSACSQPDQNVNVQCPPDATCDVNVTPPSMSPSQIQYHADRRDIADDVLVAMMIQDMAWRNCWNCYDPYVGRIPSLNSRRVTYLSLPPAQRIQTIRSENYTVLQKNSSTIQKAAANDPPAVKSVNATTSGQNGGTGGGNAATNKSSSSNPNPDRGSAPVAPAQNVTKPSAPPPSQPAPAPAKPAAPPPSQPAPAPKPAAPPPAAPSKR